MNYFTSDTHWGHHNIIKYCNRPYRNVDEMNRDMLERWNARVKPQDTVYHLGDFAFYDLARIAQLRKRLNGKIILIKGNHDRSKPKMLECGFDEVHDWLQLEGWKLQHYPAKGAYILCGHIHNRWRRIGNVINVGVDMWNFEPKTLPELLEAKQDDPSYRCLCGAVLKRLEDNSDHRGCYK